MPYQFESEPGMEASDRGDESDSKEESESSDDEVNRVFEAENAWHLETLSWCKCGHCTLKPKTIESFCCHDKALEYDTLLKEAESQGGKCLTAHEEFKANMLWEYKIKQIPKMDILDSQYSRKNKKTMESVIFRLYFKDIVQTNRLDYKQAVLYIYKVQSWQDVGSQSSEAQ